MTREEFATVWKMLIGVWPRLDNEETIAAWWGLLGHYQAHQTSASIRGWASTRRNPPAPSDIIEGVRAINKEQKLLNPQRAASAACVSCEGTGFLWQSLEGQGTVQRCDQGCKPQAQREYSRPDRVSSTPPREWIARLDALRKHQHSRLVELGEHAYLTERGYNPALFHVKQGMILARPQPN